MGVRAYHSFLSLIFSRTHILHFSPLPPSSHLHPSRTLLSRGAVSQSLTHSATHKCVTSLAQRRHHADRCPPSIPRWPGSEVLCFSGGLEGIKCYFKSRKHCVFLVEEDHRSCLGQKHHHSAICLRYIG